MVIPIKCFTDNYCYLYKYNGNDALLIDASEHRPILSEIKKKRLKLKYIFITHDHEDHIQDLYYITDKFPKAIVVYEKSARINITNECNVVNNNMTLDIGALKVGIFTTPGHSDSGLSFVIDDNIFVGDTLFGAGCGKVPDTERNMKQMWQSLLWLKKQDVNSKLYFGHDYTINNLKFAAVIDPNNKKISNRLNLAYHQEGNFYSTIQQELDTNPYFRVDIPNVQKTVMKKIKSGSDVLGLSYHQFIADNSYNIFKTIRIWKNKLLL